MKRFFSCFILLLFVFSLCVNTPVIALAGDSGSGSLIIYETEAEKQSLLTQEANKLLAGIKGNNTLTEVEKALLIHDRLAVTCSYSTGSTKGSTAFDAIVLKSAVCQGYALAYKYLLGLVGIKSEYVSSKMLNHAWNLVYINNIPYHVDVTWDDPLKDQHGRVTHENFLRSTQGMIETGHVSRDGVTIDYTSTPVNTAYDDYFWQNSTTSFQLLNSNIYYFDNLNMKLMKLNKTDGSDATLIKSIVGDWGFTEEGTGFKSFTRLASDGNFLYYSLPDKVYRFNPVTNTEEVKYTLDLSAQYGEDFKYAIWGLSYENCTFTYDYCIDDYSNWEIKRQYKEFSESAHKPSASWVVARKATTSKEGIKVKKCTVCSSVLQKTSIPKLPAAPSVAVKNTSSGIKLTWNAVANSEKYIIYKRTYNSKTKKYSAWTTLSNSHKGTSYVDKKVVLGATYSYTVKAVTSGGVSGCVATKGLKYNITPTVTVVNASNGVKVSWSTVANATGYTVYSSSYNTKTKKWSGWKSRGTAKASSKSWVDKSAKSGVKYRYTVKAMYNKTASTYNKSGVSVLYIAQPTVKIANNSNGIKVTWNKIAGAKNYKIYRAQYVNGKWSGWSGIATTNSKTFSFADKSVKSGTEYRYTVRALNGKVGSSYKESNTLFYLAQPKPTFSNTSNGIKVSWKAVPGATSYKVYSSTYNASTKKWSSWKGCKTVNAPSWTDSSVKSGVYYKYTVKAVKGSSESTFMSAKGLIYLAQPTVKSSKVNDSAKITWNKIAGATGYRIYRKANNEKSWSTLATVKGTSFTDVKVSDGSTYTYTVRAYKGETWSAYSTKGVTVTFDKKKEVFNLVNAERKKVGLEPLKYYSGAQRAADIRAKEIVKTFSHTRPDGTLCFTAFSEIGVTYRFAGENIAKGQPTPEIVMDAWMNSPGHKANILNPDFTHIVVGYDKDSRAWVQMFLG